MGKRVLAMMLAVMLAVSPIGTIKSMAEEDDVSDMVIPAEEDDVSDMVIPAENIYIEQQAGGLCTLASAVMMLRTRMYLSGNHLWSFVTEDSLRPAAWMEGVGLHHGWSYEIDGSRMNVAFAETAGMSAEALKALLDIHPEGVEIYDRGDEEHSPHAVYVTDYEGDTFYCADPAPTYSCRRMPLAESLIGARYDGMQETVLGTIDAYWYVGSHSIEATGNPENIIPFFFDLPKESPYYNAVLWAVENDLVAGTDETHFAPDANITRGEAVISLWKAVGCPEPYNVYRTFADISKDDAGYEAVLWAAETGIMPGTDEGKFAPDKNITWEMMCGIGMDMLSEDSFGADTPVTRADFVQTLYQMNCYENASVVY